MPARFENSRNPFLRKGEALSLRARKLRMRPAQGAPGELPPVLINSVPKSGTHLLTQVVEALPGVQNLGEFFVSTPSLTMREIRAEKMVRRLMRLTPGETAKGHLFWHSEYSAALRKSGTVSYFIYRDPRDIVVSEAVYLADMNRYHRLHRVYRKLSEPERLMLAIKGSPDLLAQGVFYPDIATRMGRYLAWREDGRVLAVRFEDLRGEKQAATVQSIVEHYARKSVLEQPLEHVVHTAISSIDPSRSHTFRAGTRGGWRSAFSDDHKDAFKEVAGQLLIDLGYESDQEW